MTTIVFRVPNDIAQFAVTGGVARWISSPNNRDVLKFLHQIPDQVTACDRGLFKQFTLAGPPPVYPADYTGERTVAADFGSIA